MPLISNCLQLEGCGWGSDGLQGKSREPQASRTDGSTEQIIDNRLSGTQQSQDVLRKGHHGFWEGKLCFPDLLEFSKPTFLLEKDVSECLDSKNVF